jgi:pSer/pThr/pTyr-binding forkhead associated (FHA) protein
MFDLFKKDTETPPQDVKGVRDALLRFVKEQLQKVEGGEGTYIKGLELFIACSEEEKHIYEAAVNFQEDGRFKNEVQRIADDFAIDLPGHWTMDINFVETMPSEAIKVSNLNAALFIKTNKQTLQKAATAHIRILNGEAEQELYTITSAGGRINIGREKRVQNSDGFFRVNTIAFPADKNNDSNKYISRQHAHIEWNNDCGCFLLFADEGGVPPRNKIKIRSTSDEAIVKIHSTKSGHQLQDGDQVILGESAVLEFSYFAGEE